MHGEENRRRYVVGIETSGATGSVAVVDYDGQEAERSFRGHLTHARELIAVLDALTKEVGAGRDELALVSVSQGPGSYTGIRVGVTAAKCLAWALGTEAAGVMSLDVIARGVAPQGSPARLHVVVDAKRGVVYHAAYSPDAETWRREGAPAVLPPETVVKLVSPGEILVGDGIALIDAPLSGVQVLAEAEGVPRAAHVARMGIERMLAGRTVAPGELLPIYMRAPEAVELWEARRKRRATGQ